MQSISSSASARANAEPHGATNSSSGNALELQSVSRLFGALKAIDSVSFDVPAGQRHAVLGSNGAGKTTLFNAITGDILPTSGRVLFFGEDVTALPTHERIRRGLRRTYQSSLLLRELTVRDNLYLSALGVRPGRFRMRRPQRDDSCVAAANELLEISRISHLADRPVASLAHGQQRQLEIGMALAGSPLLILFDEPSAGLSPGERQELMKLLSGLPRSIGYVIIEHDLEIALGAAETVSVMHNGRVLKQGTPEEIQHDGEVRAIYMGKDRHGH